MDDNSQHLDTLKDIKQMMERSSRFISLSGLSGIAAGICALVGAWFAEGIIGRSGRDVLEIKDITIERGGYGPIRGGNVSVRDYMGSSLFLIAVIVLIAALVFGFLFTYLRSRKTNTPIWGTTARRLLINVSIPLIAGGVYLLKLIENESYGLVAPGCLLFYGLALLNASRYTLTEIRYLGYAQILLGLISLYFIGNGLLFWALGFGVLHIVYGTFMWWKYERNEA